MSQKHVLIVSDNKWDDGFTYADLCDTYDAIPHMAALESDYAEYEGEPLLSLAEKLKELDEKGIKPDLIVIEDRKNAKWPDHMRGFMHEVATTNAMDEIPDGFAKKIISAVKDGKAPSIREAFLEIIGDYNDSISRMMGLTEEVANAAREDLENSELTAKSIEQIQKILDNVKFREEMKDPFHRSLANSNYSDAAEKYAVALREKYPKAHIIATGLFSGRVSGFRELVNRAYQLSNDNWKDEFKEILYTEEKQKSDNLHMKKTIDSVTAGRLKKDDKLKSYTEAVKKLAAERKGKIMGCYAVLDALQSEGITFKIKTKRGIEGALSTLFSCVDTEVRKDFDENKYRFQSSESAKRDFVYFLGWNGPDVGKAKCELYVDEVINYIKHGLHAFDPEVYNNPQEKNIGRSS